jgi:hypothetical protein
VAAFATLLICPCARPKQPKVSGQFGTRTWSDLLARAVCERRAVSRAYQGRSARGKARGFRTRADPQDCSLRYLADLPLCAPKAAESQRAVWYTDSGARGNRRPRDLVARLSIPLQCDSRPAAKPRNAAERHRAGRDLRVSDAQPRALCCETRPSVRCGWMLCPA